MVTVLHPRSKVLIANSERGKIAPKVVLQRPARSRMFLHLLLTNLMHERTEGLWPIWLKTQRQKISR